MSATPVIVWVTSGTRAKLDRIAYQRGTCREEVGGDLLTEAVRAVKADPPPLSEPDERPALNITNLRAALGGVPDDVPNHSALPDRCSPLDDSIQHNGGVMLAEITKRGRLVT